MPTLFSTRRFKRNGFSSLRATGHPERIERPPSLSQQTASLTSPAAACWGSLIELEREPVRQLPATWPIARRSRAAVRSCNPQQFEPRFPPEGTMLALLESQLMDPREISKGLRHSTHVFAVEFRTLLRIEALALDDDEKDLASKGCRSQNLGRQAPPLVQHFCADDLAGAGPLHLRSFAPCNRVCKTGQARLCGRRSPLSRTKVFGFVRAES